MFPIEFFGAKDIAEMFGLKTTVTAIKLMKDWGVPCYFLGAGRKRGYRWKRKDVLEAIQIRMVTDTPPKKRKKKSVLDDADAFWNQEISKINELCARI